MLPTITLYNATYYNSIVWYDSWNQSSLSLPTLRMFVLCTKYHLKHSAIEIPRKMQLDFLIESRWLLCLASLCDAYVLYVHVLVLSVGINEWLAMVPAPRLVPYRTIPYFLEYLRSCSPALQIDARQRA